MLGIVDDIDLEGEEGGEEERKEKEVHSPSELMSIEIGDEELDDLMDFMSSPQTTQRESKVQRVLSEHVKDGTEIINENAALPVKKTMVVIEDTDIKDESEEEDEDGIGDDVLNHAMQMSADMDVSDEEKEDVREEEQKKVKKKGGAESMQFEIDADMMD